MQFIIIYAFTNSSSNGLGSKWLMGVPDNLVSMAEWSKAPDSSSGLRKGAWVRTPLLTRGVSTFPHFCSLQVSLLTTLFFFDLGNRGRRSTCPGP